MKCCKNEPSIFAAYGAPYQGSPEISQIVSEVQFSFHKIVCMNKIL